MKTAWLMNPDNLQHTCTVLHRIVPKIVHLPTRHSRELTLGELEFDTVMTDREDKQTGQRYSLPLSTLIKKDQLTAMKPTAAYWLAGSPIKPWNAEQLACLVFLSFFIYSNLIAIFQRRMTWWKWPGKINIIWITIYKLLTKHLHLLICDFDIKVCPTPSFMLTKGNIMRIEKGLFISATILPPPFSIFVSTFIMEIQSKAGLLPTSALAFADSQSCRGRLCPHSRAG